MKCFYHIPLILLTIFAITETYGGKKSFKNYRNYPIEIKTILPDYIPIKKRAALGCSGNKKIITLSNKHESGLYTLFNPDHPSSTLSHEEYIQRVILILVRLTQNCPWKDLGENHSAVQSHYSHWRRKNEKGKSKWKEICKILHIPTLGD